jgi:hypothetical protein
MVATTPSPVGTEGSAIGDGTGMLLPAVSPPLCQSGGTTSNHSGVRSVVTSSGDRNDLAAGVLLPRRWTGKAPLLLPFFLPSFILLISILFGSIISRILGLVLV